MRSTLKAGIEYRFSFIIDGSKFVPALYPDSDEFQAMPNVFAERLGTPHTFADLLLNGPGFL